MDRTAIKPVEWDAAQLAQALLNLAGDLRQSKDPVAVAASKRLYEGVKKAKIKA